jgi:hypothetical protein
MKAACNRFDLDFFVVEMVLFSLLVIFSLNFGIGI